MRPSTSLGLVAVVAILAGLGYLVTQTAASGEDWVELAVICVAALGMTAALQGRRFRRTGRKRTIKRTPESRW